MFINRFDGNTQLHCNFGISKVFVPAQFKNGTALRGHAFKSLVYLGLKFMAYNQLRSTFGQSFGMMLLVMAIGLLYLLVFNPVEAIILHRPVQIRFYRSVNFNFIAVFPDI